MYYMIPARAPEKLLTRQKRGELFTRDIVENAGVTGRKHHRKCRRYRQKTSQKMRCIGRKHHRKMQIPSAENITENTRDVRGKGKKNEVISGSGYAEGFY